MVAKIHTEGSAVRWLTLDVAPAEWLVINKALKMYRENLLVPREDVVLCDEMIEAVLGSTKKEKCAICVESGTKWCGDCTENGGHYNYFNVR